MYVFSAGTSPSARVERTIHNDGSEALTGVTSLRQNKLTEYAEIGPDGRLVYADVSLAGPGGVARRLILDAAHGVFYTQDELGSGWKRLSKDEPIVYANFSDGGDGFVLSATPVSAWVMLRASEASEDVRVLDPTRRESRLIPRDQLVATDGDERLVIAGDTVLAANDEFVTSLGDATLEPLWLSSISLRPHRTAQR